MDDRDIVRQIGELAEEERRLEEAHRRSGGTGLSPEEAGRMQQLAETLDQLWDLLRQRRALRDAGRDPSEALERPAGTVEHYLQ